MKTQIHTASPSPVVAASAFAALGSEQRLSIVQTLVRAGPSGLTIGELGQRSGIVGSTLTHHLKILAASELVAQSKNGRSTLCKVDYAKIESLSKYLLDNCCVDAKNNASSKVKRISPV